MKSLRETIRKIIRDDALYRRRDLPGDIDDPVSHDDSHDHRDDHEDCDCGCERCQQLEDFVNPKYALYSLIGDAIEIYDRMEEDYFPDDDINNDIMMMAHAIRNMKS